MLVFYDKPGAVAAAPVIAGAITGNLGIAL